MSPCVCMCVCVCMLLSSSLRRACGGANEKKSPLLRFIHRRVFLTETTIPPQGYAGDDHGIRTVPPRHKTHGATCVQYWMKLDGEKHFTCPTRSRHLSKDAWLMSSNVKREIDE